LLTHAIIRRGEAAVNDDVCADVRQLVLAFLGGVLNQPLRALEQNARLLGAEVARLVLTAVLGLQARRAAEDCAAARGLDFDGLTFRDEADYRVTIKTTVGRVDVPGMVWRDKDAAGRGITRRAGVDAIAPLRGRCSSSPLLLEWECNFAQAVPFRLAADELRWVTDGAADVEDTRLSAHAYAIGGQITRPFLYRTPEQIRRVLLERAQRERGGKPILYASTDASALRRFVDTTTTAAWKMANGTRLWCIDRFTSEVIHIGGEYTWDDCHAVRAALVDLDKLGILPRDGDYGGGCRATICVIADGAEWIREHFESWFTAPVAVLDVWHLSERLERDACAMLGDGTGAQRRLTRQVGRVLFGSSSAHGAKAAPKPRRGRKNRRRDTPRELPAGGSPVGDVAEKLIALIEGVNVSGAAAKVKSTLLAFLRANAHRLNYRRLRWCGFCIGSGAMESIHRTAVQRRIKLPGATWTAENSAAIFKLRMMKLAGRWEDFWGSIGMQERLRATFPKQRRHPLHAIRAEAL